MGHPSGEKFAPAGGRITGGLGLAVVAVMVGIEVFDPSGIPLLLLAACLVAAVLMWATMLRPQVSTADGNLVLRNAFATVLIPLAAVEDLSVRQVLAVRTARRRYVGSGVGRTVRQAVKSRPADGRTEAVGPTLGAALGGDAPSQVDSGMAYADWVELRLRDLVQEDRERRGIRAYSDQAEALADDVVRQPARLELAALVVTVLLFVVLLVPHLR